MATYTIRGAQRNLNARGRGPETFTRVLRGGQWRWVSDRLPSGTFLAADRRAATYGLVEPGEIIVRLGRELPARRCAITAWRVVLAAPADPAKPLRPIVATRASRTTYSLALPDGSTLTVPDPLARD